MTDPLLTIARADRIPCRGKTELFDSVEIADHYAARQLCSTCPAIIACGQNLKATWTASDARGRPAGTWAGILIGAPIRGIGNPAFKVRPKRGVA